MDDSGAGENLVTSEGLPNIERNLTVQEAIPEKNITVTAVKRMSSTVINIIANMLDTLLSSDETSTRML